MHGDGTVNHMKVGICWRTEEQVVQKVWRYNESDIDARLSIKVMKSSGRTDFTRIALLSCRFLNSRSN